MAKFNVKFSESVYRLLAGMALERGQTMADVLRDEVCRGAWLDDQLRQRHRVLIERGKGKLAELAFAHESLLNPAGRPLPQDMAPVTVGAHLDRPAVPAAAVSRQPVPRLVTAR
jgi:hypothetical protein